MRVERNFEQVRLLDATPARSHERRVTFAENLEAHRIIPSRDAQRLEHLMRLSPPEPPRPAPPPARLNIKIVPRASKEVKRLKTIAHLCVYATIAAIGFAPLLGPVGVVPPLVFLGVMLVCLSRAHGLEYHQAEQAKLLTRELSLINGERTLDLRNLDLKTFRVNLDNFSPIDTFHLSTEQIYQLLKR